MQYYMSTWKWSIIKYKIFIHITHNFIIVQSTPAITNPGSNEPRLLGTHFFVPVVLCHYLKSPTYNEPSL